MGADSPKSTLETADHVPKAEHIDSIKSCLIRDDLHMKAHLHSKGHLLTPALKEIPQTRAKCLLQWHTENGHKNIPLMDEFSPLRSSVTTSATRFVLKSPLRCVRGCRRPSPFVHHGLVGGGPIRGWHPFIFARKVWKLVPKCIKRLCYKLWNLLT